MEQDAIIATAMDYFMGWFEGDAARMERALHPDLVKRHVPAGGTGLDLSKATTTSQMIGWTREGVGTLERPADLEITVKVDDIFQQIATATVHSSVYIEYLQLVRTPVGWRIANALYMHRTS